jgi:hypothetical protein
VPGFPDNSLAESLASPTARNRDGNWVNNGNNSVTPAGSAAVRATRRRIPGVRYAHPTDGRSTLVAITEAGLEAQRQGWQQHQDKVAVAFADLPAADQERLLAISRDLTAIFRKRLAGQSPDGDRDCAPSRGMARALTRRRQPGTRA